MSRVVEIDEAIRRAEAAESRAFQHSAKHNKNKSAFRAWDEANSHLEALRAARARGETHVTVEDE